MKRLIINDCSYYFHIMYIDKEKALKYVSQLNPVDDIASIVKQPIKLAGRTQINRANNSIDIALGASIKVPGGFTLTVREKGVEVSGVTNWDNQKESQEASDMAGALATLLRNASGQMNHVGTDSSGIARWNENDEKVLSYFGIDTSKDFTVNGVKYTKGVWLYEKEYYSQSCKHSTVSNMNQLWIVTMHFLQKKIIRNFGENVDD